MSEAGAAHAQMWDEQIMQLITTRFIRSLHPYVYTLKFGV